MYIPLSALQHYVFCPRQCALIHNGGIWADNYLTATGNQLHKRVDSGQHETRGNMRYGRNVPVASEKYGLTGKLDLLEYDRVSGLYTPVEYKKGRPKDDLSDLVQLCAQALCIEEMCNVSVAEGAFWYWGIRKRVRVPIDQSLREKTSTIIDKVKELLSSGITPAACFSRACRSCSLEEACMPKLACDQSSAYMQKIFEGGS